MSYESDIAHFIDKLRRRQETIFFELTGDIYQSIKEGSRVTGAPGQPVDSSDLKNSWNIEYLEPFLSQISSPMEYAKSIEEGQQGSYGNVHPAPMVLRSEVGGFHSVKLTRQGFQRLVDEAVARVL